MAEAELRAIPGHYENVVVDKFVVMPNHVHLVVVIDGTHAFSPAAETSCSGCRVPASETKPANLLSIVGLQRRCDAQVSRAWN